MLKTGAVVQLMGQKTGIIPFINGNINIARIPRTNSAGLNISGGGVAIGGYRWNVMNKNRTRIIRTPSGLPIIGIGSTPGQ